jgi:hypothetical protein
MAKKDKDIESSSITTKDDKTNNVAPKITDLEWTDYVLSLLSEDEKIAGNPTTDGLRRIFELALNCAVISATSQIVQSPSPENEKRATAVHSITYVLKKDGSDTSLLNEGVRTIEGAADVYWGNCDKIYRNHPVAVAETRAEGRALRRALRLRKVVAAEELAKDIEDHPDENTVSKISNNQINFIDVMSQRLNINVTKLLEGNNLLSDNVYNLLHEDAVSIIRLLSKFQQNTNDIPNDILGYSTDWK